MVEIEIEYGNHYRLLKKYRTTKSGYALKNQMTCFVRLKDDNLKIEDYIDKVEFWKHESFANAHIPVVQHASRPKIGNQYRLSTRKDELTWSDCVYGSFDVPVTIHFRKHLNLKPMKQEFHISFDKPTTLKCLIL